jgi:hypothetical protein
LPRNFHLVFINNTSWLAGRSHRFSTSFKSL